ncbi:MAG: asparaginase [Pseudomonadota bacterium]
MGQDQALVHIIRGDLVESVHRGHAVICDGAGNVLEAWGAPETVIFPRSSCKMIQALPLLETGAGRALSDRHLALACASHSGGQVHTNLAAQWLADLGLAEGDLRCGPQWPDDLAARDGLIRAQARPCQVHNNCSGKHCGFLMLGQQIGGGPDYVAVDHPVQRLVRQTFEEVTDAESPGFSIDGCAAPNFATPLAALAGAMGRFARARVGGTVRHNAMARLVRAMATHPLLVAGEGRACTDLMRATDGRAVVKTGAEAVYVGILPELDRGVAVKISDGSTRAAEAVIAALLVRLGVLERQAPVVTRLCHGPIRNRREMVTGRMQVLIDTPA